MRFFRGQNIRLCCGCRLAEATPQIQLERKQIEEYAAKRAAATLGLGYIELSTSGLANRSEVGTSREVRVLIRPVKAVDCSRFIYASHSGAHVVVVK